MHQYECTLNISKPYVINLAQRKLYHDRILNEKHYVYLPYLSLKNVKTPIFPSKSRELTRIRSDCLSLYGECEETSDATGDPADDAILEVAALIRGVDQGHTGGELRVK